MLSLFSVYESGDPAAAGVDDSWPRVPFTALPS